MSTPATTRPIRLGLRANLAQFSLLVAVNALVGGMLGQERTVLSPLAEREFHLSAYTAALTYILAFGATKAVTTRTRRGGCAPSWPWPGRPTVCSPLAPTRCSSWRGSRRVPARIDAGRWPRGRPH